jgi:hypothetical protein
MQRVSRRLGALVYAFRGGRFGLVFNRGDARLLTPAARRERRTHSLNQEIRAHFILERYGVDDDGNICLGEDQSLDELSAHVELFKAELDSALRQAREYVASRTSWSSPASQAS